MIKLGEGGFAEMWRGEKSPEVISISYALQMQVVKILTAVEKTKCFSDMDKLEESTLDYFAVEMRAMYYDQELPIETKRSIVKNTMNWYTKGGTTSAVMELLSIIFNTANLEEWFNYSGDPFRFRVVVPAREGSSIDNLNALSDLIVKIKNVRSQMDELVLEEKSILKLKTKDGLYRMCPPRCGTIPKVSTGFRQGIANLILSGTESEGTSRMPHTGIPKTNQEGGLIK